MKKQVPIPVVVVIVLAVMVVCGFIYSRQQIESPPPLTVQGTSMKDDMAASTERKRGLLAKQAKEKQTEESGKKDPGAKAQVDSAKPGGIPPADKSN